MKNSLFVAMIAVAAPAWAAYGSSQAGTSAAPFLTFGADARAAGMGGAISAVADDASAIYWNPANLASLDQRQATFTHSASYQNTFEDFLAYAEPIAFRGERGRRSEVVPDRIGTAAASVQYENAGRISEVDTTGTATGSSFTPQDFAVSLGWASELLRGLDAGFAVKYVSSKIEATAQTGAADLGARFRAEIPDTDIELRLSAAVRNLGGGMKFRDASDALPTTAVAGAAVSLWHSLTVDADLSAPRDRAPYVSVGAEWRVTVSENVSAAMRAGYDGRLSSTDIGGTRGITAGGGLGFRRFGFDYAWAPSGELGSTQRLTLSYRF